ALAAFLLPIGIAYLVAGVERGETLEVMLYVGLAFTILPLLILIVSIFRRNRDDVWALLVQRTSTSEITETIDSPEPTSIEFKKLFSQLTSYALNAEKRKLVIVVDNLDRVGPSE